MKFNQKRFKMYSKYYFDFIKNNPEKPWSRNPMPLQKRMWAAKKLQEWPITKFFMVKDHKKI